MRITLNLMPAAIAARREARRRQRVLVGIPVLIVLAILLPYLLLTSQISAARRGARDAEQQLAPLQPVAIQLTQLQQETDAFRTREQEIRGLVQAVPRRAALLDGIRSIIPRDMWLRTLSLAQDRISIQGSALQRLSVVRFAQDLNRIGIFEVQIQFLRQERAGTTDLTTFQLTARVRSSTP
ncbi:MAG: PilN domain-containing protein [Burkholderiales bacterium]